ncbi:MAG: amidohydrolase [Candidatus Riflebacteria bacterium]|nr:amidohydrolase [Candidatus Riflebacteria bacterium]
MKKLFFNFHGRDYPDYSVDSFDSFLIESDRIIEIGFDLQNNEELKDVSRFDLNGNYVFPAFCDTHIHFLESGIDQLGVDLKDCQNIDQILEKISDANKKSPETWILGWNLDETVLKENRFPTLKELDKVAPHKKLWISRVDLHSALPNSSALEWAYSSEKNLQVNLNRIWKESYLQLMGKIISNLSPETIKIALELAKRKCHEFGISFVHALSGGKGIDFRVVEQVADFLEGNDFHGVVYHQSETPDLVLKRKWNRIGGCLMVDGSFGSRSAAMNSPYHDDQENSGTIYLSEEKIWKLLEMAHQNNLQLALHCIGDRAISHLMKVHLKAFEQFGKPTLSHRIEHFEVPDKSAIETALKCGIFISVQPAFEALWGGKTRMYEKRLGPDRIWKTNPFKTMLKAGLQIAAGSDSPVTSFNPFLGIDGFVNHPNGEERISLNEAFAAYLFSPHLFYGGEKTRGRLKAGYTPDFCLFSNDPFFEKPENLRKLKIKKLYVEGNLIHEN